ncbi:hypothetical protein FOL46_005380 [Perkinsus olseni]|uniref:Uncharacterized protein n=1 Tax=Perkinsus olseni TaxID=32597 RepID=A0A7J6LSS2_PEROL|nr:hypothetical protein FOL46_005380 [Perkinsus olseni]
MSPKQFIIIGVSAAAALLSNSPLVTAIGSVAQHNTPTDGYPPQDGGSGISLGGNFVTSVTYRTFWGGAGPVERGIEIRIVKSRLQTAWVRCPEAGNQVTFAAKGTCSAVRVVKKNYPSYVALCARFYNETQGAVDAAESQEWEFRDIDRQTVEIFPRRR